MTAWKLTVAQATARASPPAAGEAAVKGDLSPGKLADLVVLDRDIFRVPPMEILETGVLGTMVGGKWAFVGERFDAG